MRCCVSPAAAVSVSGLTVLAVSVSGLTLAVVSVLGLTVLAASVFGLIVVAVSVFGMTVVAVSVLGLTVVVVSVLGLTWVILVLLGLAMFAVSVVGMPVVVGVVAGLAVVVVVIPAPSAVVNRCGLIAVGVVLQGPAAAMVVAGLAFAAVVLTLAAALVAIGLTVEMVVLGPTVVVVAVSCLTVIVAAVLEPTVFRICLCLASVAMASKLAASERVVSVSSTREEKPPGSVAAAVFGVTVAGVCTLPSSPPLGSPPEKYAPVTDSPAAGDAVLAPPDTEVTVPENDAVVDVSALCPFATLAGASAVDPMLVSVLVVCLVDAGESEELAGLLALTGYVLVGTGDSVELAGSVLLGSGDSVELAGSVLLGSGGSEELAKLLDLPGSAASVEKKKKKRRKIAKTWKL